MSDPATWWQGAVVSSWMAVSRDIQGLAPFPIDLRTVISELAVTTGALGSSLLQAVSSSGWPSDQEFCSQWASQHSWAQLLSANSHQAFESSAPPRLRDLRLAQSAPHSGDWLVSTSSTALAGFTNPECQALLRYRCGAPIGGRRHCAACGAAMTQWGDHALACTAAGIYRRHYRVRDTLASLCREAGWQTQLEVALPGDPTLPGPAYRPADIFLPLVGPKPLALDVGVSHALRPSASPAIRDSLGESAERHEATKRQSMGQLCASFGWTYKPLCFESTGAWGPTATRFIKQLAWTSSVRGGKLPVETLLYSAKLISNSLALGSAEMLVRSYGL